MNSFAARPCHRLLTGRTIMCGALGVLIPMTTFAAEPGTGTPAGDTGELWFALFRMLGALALVLALFVGGLWLVRRVPVMRLGRTVPKLAVLEARSLGQRQALYVIGYEQERLLIATSPAGVTLLKQLPAAGPTLDSPATAPADFPTLMQNLLRGGRA